MTDHDDEGGEDRSSELGQFLSVQEHNNGLPTLGAVGEDSDASVESRPTLSSAELSEHADQESLPVFAGPEVVSDDPGTDLDHGQYNTYRLYDARGRLIRFPR